MRQSLRFFLCSGSIALLFACGINFHGDPLEGGPEGDDSGDRDATHIDGAPISPEDDSAVDLPDTDVAPDVFDATKPLPRFCANVVVTNGFCEDFENGLGAWTPNTAPPGLSLTTPVDAGATADQVSLLAAAPKPFRIEIGRRLALPTGIKTLDVSGRIAPLATDNNTYESLTFFAANFYTATPSDAGTSALDGRISLQIFRHNGELHLSGYLHTGSPVSDQLLLTQPVVIPLGFNATYKVHLEANVLTLEVSSNGVTQKTAFTAPVVDPTIYRVGDVFLGSLSVRDKWDDMGSITNPNNSDWKVSLDDFVFDSTPP